MFKVVALYQNIQDQTKFKEYYETEVLPAFFQVEGVIRIKLTSLLPGVQPFPEEMKGIQLMIETYFESREVVGKFLNSAKGAKFLSKIINYDSGEVGLFISNEKVFEKGDNI